MPIASPCPCGRVPDVQFFGVRPRQVAVSWCPGCSRRSWESLWPLLDLPDETHRRLMRYLDAVSATLAGQSCTQLLMVRAPECNLAPVPVFMTVNQLAPSVREGALTVRDMGADLQPFAVRSAGLRAMVHQVVVAIGLGWANAEFLHPWVEAGGQQRLQRQAACDVVALKIPLAEAASVSYLDLRWPTVVPSLRAHRPSTVRVPAPTCTVPKVSSAASQDRALALLSRPAPKASVPVPKASAVLVTGLPLSQALFRWGHLASRPVHPVSPLSGRSRTRPVSLAASSKARAMSLALVPRPPAGPPPDALLASRRAEPEPEDAEDF